MGRRNSEANDRKAVGKDLAAVLPDDTRPWYRQSHLIKLNFCILSLIMFSSANGYDGSMMNGLQALPQWQLFMNHPKGAWLGFINAITWLGSAIFYPISAWYANSYGRKSGVWIGYGFLLLATAMQTAAQNQATFVVARLFLGCASAWFSTAVPLLITETAYPTQRGVCSALFNCGWYVGSLVAAWATFGTRNYANSWAWRIPSILQVALPAVALPGFMLCTESPRWLVSRGRNEEAKQVLANTHTGGDLSAPLITFEMIEIETTLRAEQDAHASTSYLDMIKTKGNRRRLFISVSLGVFAQWSGNGVVSYYLALVLETVGITSVTDQTLISGCLQIWNLIFAVAAAACVDKLGRKFLFMTSGITMLISYIIITGLSGSFAQTGHSGTGLAVIPFLFIYFAGYDIAL
jgi:MFS family permease